MRRTAVFHRNTAAAGLVLAALMTFVSVLLMPPFDGDHADWLGSIAASGSSRLSALLFVAAQLPFAVGLVGVAHLLRDRAPVLSSLGATLAVLGGFGHAVYGGVSLLMTHMAEDPAGYDVHAAVLKDAEGSTMIPFMAAGLVGTVLGLILVAAGLWRAHVGPRWLPGALVAFVLVEFIGAGLSEWAGYASGVLFLVTFLVMAALVVRTPAGAWEPRLTCTGLPSTEPAEQEANGPQAVETF
jgi:hypothetical protein